MQWIQRNFLKTFRIENNEINNKIIYHLYFTQHILTIILISFSGDCKVPTLDEAIEFAIAKNLILLFDVKGGVHCSKVDTLCEAKPFSC